MSLLPHMISRASGRVASSWRRAPGVIAARALGSMPNNATAGRPNMALIKELREASGAPVVDCKNALAAEGVDGDIAQAFQWLRKRGIAKATSMADRSANEGLIGLRVDGSRGALIEVNSETDFVARNAKFQEFVEKALEVALEKARAGGGDSAGAKAPATRELDVQELLQAKHSGSGELLADTLAHLVGAIRENITISRVQVVSLGGDEEGVVAGYVHGAMGPGMGKNAALVALKFAASAAGDSNDATIKALDASAKSLAMHVVAARPAFLDEASAPQEALEKEKNLLLEQAKDSGKSPKVLDKMVEGRMRKYLETNALVRQAHVVAEGNPSVADHLTGLGDEVGGTVTLEGFARLAVGERESASSSGD
ncbi:unnamed protein product [Pylaiella littoralis]